MQIAPPLRRNAAWPDERPAPADGARTDARAALREADAFDAGQDEGDA